MKFLFRSALLALLPLSLLHAADEPAKPERQKLAFEVEFSNLPKEKRDEFFKDTIEAKRLYDQKRIFEALDKIHQAQLIFPNHPEVLTMQGACYVEFRSFDKARECFEKADKLAPGQSSIVFNLAEIDFVTKDWKNAEATLSKVLEMIGSEPKQMQLARLVQFKILLCKLKQGDVAGAKKLADLYDYRDDSPYVYYASAAISYHADKKEEAEMELARAGRVFGGDYLSAWQDTMIEFGYIKGFFGGDQSEDGGGGE